jgi:hypothetical protein
MAATGEARIRISAAPGKVWTMVADVTRMGEWSPETTSCEWIPPATGPKVGARFKGRNKRGRGRWTRTCEVTACVRAKEFAFVTKPESPETLWRYVFSPAAGGTEVVETFELVKPISRYRRLQTIVGFGVKDRVPDLVEGMEKTLERLRVAAEAG